MAVSDYSTTPGDNTSISGLTVTDSTVVDTLDNIIRQMMADTKSFYDSTALTGSAATITGAWAFSAIDVNGGTIDGTPIGPNSASTGAFTTLSATGAVSVAADIQHTGDTDNKITFGTDTQTFQTGGSTRMDITDSGVRLGGTGARVTTVLDEDDMSTDSATALASQQSIKAYVDGRSNTAGPVATTSGSSVNISTSIPAGVVRLTVMLKGVGLAGATDNVLVQLSTGASFVTSGYSSASNDIGSGAQSTAGFVMRCESATRNINGIMTLEKDPASNEWYAIHGYDHGGQNAHSGGGVVDLGGVVDGIRLINEGTDAFDAGDVSVRWSFI